ncbi:hypothetical protein ENUP19_0121G0150 [Entamoeba nuttalli]|uniref:Fructokinase, putative n=2 Tax=Entamoeba nuttalli TaxID=412467 RepID=K2GYX1_ENTNP|nr:fructokinase, putative [Entamoeba nuttalli P19]EKE39047.1 fructokinase, putative [Entamoeba nuttalli P19]|eukprot:XP_008858615.1 fructokinase, putative [Entamoeba nuttalli P19]
MNHKKIKVAGIGEVVWDCFGDVKKQGGAPCNFAMHMAQFGFESYAFIAVGNDELGKRSLEIIHSFGVQTIDPVVDYETSTVIITLHNGIPSYNVKLNVAWDHLKLTDSIIEKAKELDAVCFGTIAQRSEETRKSITQFLKLMKPNSLKVFDVNLRQHFYNNDIIQESLSLSNIVKMSDEEIQEVGKACGFQGNDLEILKQIHHQYHLKYSLLTLGEKGSYVYDGTNEIFCEPTKVNVVNTVGAGDSFTAIFVGSILKGKSIEQAQKLASKVASYVCTQDGAMPKLTQEFLSELK